jgi:hypothetical protein
MNYYYYCTYISIEIEERREKKIVKKGKKNKNER